LHVLLLRCHLLGDLRIPRALCEQHVFGTSGKNAKTLVRVVRGVGLEADRHMEYLSSSSADVIGERHSLGQHVCLQQALLDCVIELTALGDELILVLNADERSLVWHDVAATLGVLRGKRAVRRLR